MITRMDGMGWIVKMYEKDTQDPSMYEVDRLSFRINSIPRFSTIEILNTRIILNDHDQTNKKLAIKMMIFRRLIMTTRACFAFECVHV